MGFGLQNPQILVLYLEYAYIFFFFCTLKKELAVSLCFAIRHN